MFCCPIHFSLWLLVVSNCTESIIFDDDESKKLERKEDIIHQEKQYLMYLRYRCKFNGNPGRRNFHLDSVGRHALHF